MRSSIASAAASAASRLADAVLAGSACVASGEDCGSGDFVKPNERLRNAAIGPALYFLIDSPGRTIGVDSADADSEMDSRFSTALVSPAGV